MLKNKIEWCYEIQIVFKKKDDCHFCTIFKETDLNLAEKNW